MNDRVVGDAKVIEQIQQHADMHVMFDHAVCVFVVAGIVAVVPDMGAEMHPRAVPPNKKSLIVFNRVANEIHRGFDGFIIHALHALDIERPGIFDLLRDAVRTIAGARPDHTARPEGFQKCSNHRTSLVRPSNPPSRALPRR